MLLSSRKELLLISFFSVMLGVIAGGSLTCWIIGHHSGLAVVLLLLCVFHCLEFFMAALYQFEFSADDFLLDNGWEYPAFLLLAPAEHIILPRLIAFPRLGLGMALIGQGIRTLAMYCSREQFAHLLGAAKLEPKLIRTGIYALVRHPSYLGFFLWSLGLQLYLGNVFCFCAAVVIMQRFFSERVRVEEAELIRVFGGEYVEYRNSVCSGIPGVS